MDFDFFDFHVDLMQALIIRFSRPPSAGGKTLVLNLPVLAIYGNLKLNF